MIANANASTPAPVRLAPFKMCFGDLIGYDFGKMDFYSIAEILRGSIASILGDDVATSTREKRRGAVLAKDIAKLISGANGNWLTIGKDIEDLKKEFSELSANEQAALNPLLDSLASLKTLSDKLNVIVEKFLNGQFRIYDNCDFKSFFSEAWGYVLVSGVSLIPPRPYDIEDYRWGWDPQTHLGWHSYIGPKALTPSNIVESLLKNYKNAVGKYSQTLVASGFSYSDAKGDDLLSLIDSYKAKVGEIAIDLQAYAKTEDANAQMELNDFKNIMDEQVE